MKRVTENTPIKLTNIKPYTFEYKNKIYRPCENGSDCCKNDYCRCGQITDVKIEKVGNILGPIEQYPMENRYCLERVLNSFGYWNTESWKAIIARGYYGEELIGFDFDLSEKAEKSCQKLLLLANIKEKIEYCLVLEYGFLLKSLEDVSSYIPMEIDIDELSILNENHYRKVNFQATQRYEDWKLPLGVCVKTKNKYDLVDGYHRLAAANRSKKNKVLMMVGVRDE